MYPEHKVAIDNYVIPSLSDTPREGLTPHTNLILDFFLENPSVVMSHGGVKVLVRFLDLADRRKAWGAIYLLVKRQFLRRVGKGVAVPQTADQLRSLPGRADILRAAKVRFGWADLRMKGGVDAKAPGSLSPLRDEV